MSHTHIAYVICPCLYTAPLAIDHFSSLLSAVQLPSISPSAMTFQHFALLSITIKSLKSSHRSMLYGVSLLPQKPSPR